MHQFFYRYVLSMQSPELLLKDPSSIRSFQGLISYLRKIKPKGLIVSLKASLPDPYLTWKLVWYLHVIYPCVAITHATYSYAMYENYFVFNINHDIIEWVKYRTYYVCPHARTHCTVLYSIVL